MKQIACGFLSLHPSAFILCSETDFEIERTEPMLVLSRKKNETLVIGDDIRVTVVEIRGDKVRLGVEAPKEIGVHRQEIYDRIQQHADRLLGTGAAQTENRDPEDVRTRTSA